MSRRKAAPDTLRDVPLEAAVIGSLLAHPGDGALHVGVGMRVPIFADPRHRTIAGAMLAAIEDDQQPDPATIRSRLSATEALEVEAGGPAYLLSLLDGAPRMPRPNLEAHYGRLADLARARQTVYALERHRTEAGKLIDQIAMQPGVASNGCLGHLRDTLNAEAATIEAPTSRLRAITADVLPQTIFPEQRPLLWRGDTPIFRAGHLAEVFAERGVGKTWFLMSLGLVAASPGAALGFHATEPCRVLHIDGEMASRDLQDRFVGLADRLRMVLPPTLTVIAADWQDGFLPRLDTDAGQAVVEPFVSEADFVILDNRSCLFDPEGEKDPTAWQPAQDWLLSLRRRGKGVMLGHHSNRQGGARGHSKPEDALNTLIKLTRPEDYSANEGARFVVSFEKSRGVFGDGAAPFEARLTDGGWHTESQDGCRFRDVRNRLVEYLRLTRAAGESPRSASQAIRAAGVKKADGLAAWADLLKRGQIGRSPDGFVALERP